MTLTQAEIKAMSKAGKVWEIPKDWWVPPNYMIGPGTPTGAYVPSGMAEMVHRIAAPTKGVDYTYIVLDWSIKDTPTNDLLTLSKLTYKVPNKTYQAMLDSKRTSFSQEWLKNQGVERVRHDEAYGPSSPFYYGKSKYHLGDKVYTVSQLLAMGAPTKPNAFDDYLWGMNAKLRVTRGDTTMKGVTTREQFFAALKKSKAITLKEKPKVPFIPKVSSTPIRPIGIQNVYPHSPSRSRISEVRRPKTRSKAFVLKRKSSSIQTRPALSKTESARRLAARRQMWKTKYNITL